MPVATIGAGLAEITPGLWVRPRQVMAVRATREYAKGGLTLQPTVTLHIPGCCEIGWEFDTHEAAVAWAAKVAATINAAEE